MDTQQAALSKIVLEGDLIPFIDARITEEFFPDPKHARIWAMVLEHFKKYGKAPDADAIHKAYPTYIFRAYPEPTTYYLHQLQQDRKKVILIKSVQAVANRINEEEGPDIGDELEILIRQGLNQAAHEISQGRDTDFFISEQTFPKLHERRMLGGKIRGISTGFPGMDRLTGGLQDEQLITLVGTSKAGKSSILLKTALNAHSEGYHPLFVTFEMSTSEQEDRLVSLLTGIALSKILNGDFDEDEERQIKKALDLRRGRYGFTITSDIFSAITVSGIQAKINQYNPDLVIIDGMYMMEDEAGNDKGTPLALTSITRSLKRLAQITRKPIIISTQAMAYRSKKGLKLDSIGYSSSFAQDSDIVFGVEKADERLEHVSKFHVLASRSTPRGACFVEFDWSRGMIEEIGEVGFQQAKDNAPAVAGTPKRTGDLEWRPE